MANNRIQIKRSASTGIPASLSAGELAYSNAIGGSGILFIGSTDGATVVPIGGVRNPGTLTANQSLVANSSSGIDKIIAANVAANSIWANGSAGTAGQLLTSNGTVVYWGPPAAAASGSDTQVQFNDGGSTLNATAGFTFTKSTNNVFVANTLLVGATVNAASFTAGAILTGTGGSVQNTTTMFVGNNTINTVITSAGLVVNGAVTVNSTGFYTGNTTDTTTGTGAFLANDTTILLGNNTINTAISTTSLSIGGYGNATTGGAAVNTTAVAIGNSTVNSSMNSSTLSIGGSTVNATTTTISSNVTFSGSTLTGTSADLSFRNGTFSGNLIVQGTVLTVNTAQITVNDNIIQLAYNQTTLDTVDTGWVSPAGNSSAIWYSGFARIAAASTNANPFFRVFVSNTNPNTSATIDTSANTATGTLWSYLRPYGNTGTGFVANATTVTITANSSVSVAITGNTLSLSGRSNNDLLYSNGTGGVLGLAFNTTGGYVLQSNGTAIVYDVLDGGTF